MISFERIDLDQVTWKELDRYEDRSVFQTLPWIRFIAEAQSAEPVIASINKEGQTLGYFTGLVVRKLGIKILGSPFRGWTTTYMGFNLAPGTSLPEVLEAFPDFAFNELGCRLMRISQRSFSGENLENSSYSVINYKNLEIDLSKSEDELFSNMHTSKRRGIRKAVKSGVIIEEASDMEFADEYCAQLEDVFAKHSLLPTYRIDRVRSLIKNVHPSGNLLLLRARNPDGQCIATAIFPAFNDTMVFWGGASWRKYQSYRPNEYIMWHAMKYWKSRGIKTFNMGGWGDYKIQYGGYKINGVVLVKSRPDYLVKKYNQAQNLWKVYRKVLGKIHRKK